MSDATPAVLSLVAGAVTGSPQPQVRAVEELDVQLWRGATLLGVLAQPPGGAPGPVHVRAHRTWPRGGASPARDLPDPRRRAAGRRDAAPGREHRVRGALTVLYSARPASEGGARHVRSGSDLTPPREPLRDRDVHSSGGWASLRHRSRPHPRALPLQEGRRGLDPGRDGRRVDRGLRRVPRHPQHRARALEGRDPLPPGRDARRGEVARDVDDLEVRAHGPAVRRREGRRRLRPEEALGARARADDPPLHERDHQRHRPRARHPGSGRRDRRPRDGVDLRHVLDEQGALGARGRHRQAALARRLARTRGGDRTGLAVLHPGARGEARASASPTTRSRSRGSGTSAATSRTCSTPRVRRSSHVSDSSSGVHNPDGIDVPAALAHKQEHGTLAGLANAEAGRRTRSSSSCRATCSRRARSSRS